MDKDRTDEFISNILVKLWPGWEPAQVNIDLWTRGLKPYEYAECERIVTDFKAESQIQYKYPPTGKLLKRISIYAKKRAAAKQANPVLVYEIYNEKNPNIKQRFFISSKDKLLSEPNLIEQEANRNREKIIAMYDIGNWIIVRHWEKLYDKTEQEPDDELRGDAARDEAHQRILAEPDTPGRRFLVNYLKERGQLPESNKELVENVGSTLSGNEIPF